jgi:hypothetical protein
MVVVSVTLTVAFSIGKVWPKSHEAWDTVKSTADDVVSRANNWAKDRTAYKVIQEGDLLDNELNAVRPIGKDSIVYANIGKHPDDPKSYPLVLVEVSAMEGTNWVTGFYPLKYIEVYVAEKPKPAPTTPAISASAPTPAAPAVPSVMPPVAPAPPVTPVAASLPFGGDVRESIVKANDEDFVYSEVVPRPGDRIRIGDGSTGHFVPCRKAEDVSRIILWVGDDPVISPPIFLQPVMLGKDQYVGQVDINSVRYASANSPEKVKVAKGSMKVALLKVGR